MSDAPAPKPTPIAAFDIYADGASSAAPDTEPHPGPDATFRWLHFDLSDPALIDWVEAHLPRSAARTLVASRTRPRVDTDGDGGLVLVLRGINLNAGAEQADMVSLRLWATEKLVVTVRRARVFAVDDVRAQIAAGDAPTTPARLIARIAEGLCERLDAVAEELEALADDVETRVYDRDEPPPVTLAPLRRKVIKMRRHVAPLSDALRMLSQMDLPLFDAAMDTRQRDIANRATHAQEELTEVHDRLTAAADHIDITQAARLERNGYRLSVAAAIFLPLGFLTGLFGVNVGGMPGVNDGQAFWVLTGAMLAFTGIIALVLRWLRWF